MVGQLSHCKGNLAISHLGENRKREGEVEAKSFGNAPSYLYRRRKLRGGGESRAEREGTFGVKNILLYETPITQIIRVLPYSPHSTLL